VRLLLAASIATLALAGPAAAQSVADHLECFKVKDPQRKAGYTADLSGLVAEPGCTIKVPAVMACAPVATTNVNPAPPRAGGSGRPSALGCYKLKCRKRAVPPLELDDQFGSRTVRPTKGKLVCASVAEATPTTITTSTTTVATSTTTTTTCLQPFTPSLPELVDAFSFLVGASGNFAPPASCGGSTPVCCPGGVLAASCGPLHADLTAASLGPSGDPNLFFLSLRMHLATVADLPVSVPVVGDCLIHIDTMPGPSSTIQIDVPVLFSADHLRISQLGDSTLTDMTVDDVALGGGIGCQLANLGLGFFIDILQASLVENLLQLDGLCRLCDSGAIARCGP
jgi:hypothetical protein